MKQGEKYGKCWDKGICIDFSGWKMYHEYGKLSRHGGIIRFFGTAVAGRLPCFDKGSRGKSQIPAFCDEWKEFRKMQKEGKWVQNMEKTSQNEGESCMKFNMNRNGHSGRVCRGNGGFTLVELIVVIAILAILGGVAVPAYSGYVEKANKGADLALVGEIKHALTVAYYANSSEFKGGTIVGVSYEADAEAYDDFAAAAMEAAFGEDWEQSAQLKYDGWKSKNVEVSRFKGKETDLLGRVDYLTTSLQKPLNAFVGDNFKKFMDENGIDSSDEKTVSNAAVMYVVNNTANLSDAQQAEIIDIFSNGMTAGGADKMLKNIQDVCDGDLVTAAASMYAIATAYSTYSGQEFNVEFTDNETPESAGAKIYNAFNKLAMADMTKAKEYLEGGHVDQDFKAYLDILNTADKAKGQIIDKLGSLGTTGGGTWSSTYEGIFTSYNNGGVFVFLELDENGVPVAGTTLVEE